MSAHNKQTLIKQAQRFGGRMFHWSGSAPSGSEVGFAPGAWWVYCNGGSSKLYVNIGTTASATWKYCSAS